MIRVVWIGIWIALLTFAAADPLAAVLAKVDQAAVGFKGYSANVRRVQHTGVINEDIVDTGTFLMKRPKPNDARFLYDVKQPDPEQVAFDGRKFEQYLPKAQTVQECDVSKYKGLVNEFLLLGFGTSSKELQTGYTITYGSPETVNGEKTTRLQLIPKSPDQLTHLTRVDVWISDATGLPAQQKFYLPGGDYQMATYSNVSLNPNIPESALKLNLPKGVKRESPCK